MITKPLSLNPLELMTSHKNAISANTENALALGLQMVEKTFVDPEDDLQCHAFFTLLMDYTSETIRIAQNSMLVDILDSTDMEAFQSEILDIIALSKEVQETVGGN
jgi:hypothetical protein